jgi:hypothetical protein
MAALVLLFLCEVHIAAGWVCSGTAPAQGNIIGDSGIILTDSDGEGTAVKYASNLNCSWTISCATAGSVPVFSLKGKLFGWDSFKIYRGSQFTDQLLYVVQHQAPSRSTAFGVSDGNGPDFSVDTSSVLVHLVAPGNPAGPGMRLAYQCRPLRAQTTAVPLPTDSSTLNITLANIPEPMYSDAGPTDVFSVQYLLTCPDELPTVYWEGGWTDKTRRVVEFFFTRGFFYSNGRPSEVIDMNYIAWRPEGSRWSSNLTITLITVLKGNATSWWMNARCVRDGRWNALDSPTGTRFRLTEPSDVIASDADGSGGLETTTVNTNTTWIVQCPANTTFVISESSGTNYDCGSGYVDFVARMDWMTFDGDGTPLQIRTMNYFSIINATLDDKTSPMALKAHLDSGRPSSDFLYRDPEVRLNFRAWRDCYRPGFELVYHCVPKVVTPTQVVSLAEFHDNSTRDNGLSYDPGMVETTPWLLVHKPELFAPADPLSNQSLVENWATYWPTRPVNQTPTSRYLKSFLPSGYRNGSFVTSRHWQLNCGNLKNWTVAIQFSFGSNAWSFDQFLRVVDATKTEEIPFWFEGSTKPTELYHFVPPVDVYYNGLSGSKTTFNLTSWCSRYGSNMPTTGCPYHRDYRSQVFGSQPEAYWPLDECNPNSTTVQDVTGNGHDGNATGRNALTMAIGTPLVNNEGSAIQFSAFANDSSTKVSDRVVIPGWDKDVFTGSGGSWEFWVARNGVAFTGLQDIVSDLVGTPYTFSAAFQTAISSTIQLAYSTGDSVNPWSAFPVSGATHVVVVYNTSTANGTRSYYINGKLKSSTTTLRPPPANIPRGNKAFFGRSDGKDDLSAGIVRGGGSYILDEVAFYRRPLNATEIQNHYNVGSSSAASSRMGYTQSIFNLNDGRAGDVISSDPDGSQAVYMWSFGSRNSTFTLGCNDTQLNAYYQLEDLAASMGFQWGVVFTEIDFTAGLNDDYIRYGFREQTVPYGLNSPWFEALTMVGTDRWGITPYLVTAPGVVNFTVESTNRYGATRSTEGWDVTYRCMPVVNLSLALQQLPGFEKAEEVTYVEEGFAQNYRFRPITNGLDQLGLTRFNELFDRTAQNGFGFGIIYEKVFDCPEGVDLDMLELRINSTKFYRGTVLGFVDGLGAYTPNEFGQYAISSKSFGPFTLTPPVRVIFRTYSDTILQNVTLGIQARCLRGGRIYCPLNPANFTINNTARGTILGDQDGLAPVFGYGNKLTVNCSFTIQCPANHWVVIDNLQGKLSDSPMTHAFLNVRDRLRIAAGANNYHFSLGGDVWIGYAKITGNITTLPFAVEDSAASINYAQNSQRWPDFSGSNGWMLQYKCCDTETYKSSLVCAYNPAPAPPTCPGSAAGVLDPTTQCSTCLSGRIVAGVEPICTNVTCSYPGRCSLIGTESVLYQDSSSRSNQLNCSCNCKPLFAGDACERCRNPFHNISTNCTTCLNGKRFPGCDATAVSATSSPINATAAPNTTANSTQTPATTLAPLNSTDAPPSSNATANVTEAPPTEEPSTDAPSTDPPTDESTVAPTTLPAPPTTNAPIQQTTSTPIQTSSPLATTAIVYDGPPKVSISPSTISLKNFFTKGFTLKVTALGNDTFRDDIIASSLNPCFQIVVPGGFETLLNHLTSNGNWSLGLGVGDATSGNGKVLSVKYPPANPEVNGNMSLVNVSIMFPHLGDPTSGPSTKTSVMLLFRPWCFNRTTASVGEDPINATFLVGDSVVENPTIAPTPRVLINAKVADSTTAAVAASTMVSGLAAATGPAAAQAARSRALMQAEVCSVDYGQLPFITHPLQFGIGSTPVQYYVGAAIGNLAVIVGVLLLHGILAFLFSRCSSDVSTMQQICGRIRFPSFGWVFVMFLGQDTVVAVTIVLMWYDTVEVYALIAAGASGLFWLAIPFLILYFSRVGNPTKFPARLRLFPSVVRHAQPAWRKFLFGTADWEDLVTRSNLTKQPRRGSFNEDGDKESEYERSFLRDDHSPEPKPAAAAGDEKPFSGFTGAWDLLFTCYTFPRRWFMAIEVFMVIAVGVAVGVRPDHGICNSFNIPLVVMFAVYFVLLIWLQPYKASYDLVPQVLMTGLQLAAASLLFWPKLVGWPGYLALAAMGVSLLKAVADVVILVLDCMNCFDGKEDDQLIHGSRKRAKGDPLGDHRDSTSSGSAGEDEGALYAQLHGTGNLRHPLLQERPIIGGVPELIVENPMAPAKVIRHGQTSEFATDAPGQKRGDWGVTVTAYGLARQRQSDAQHRGQDPGLGEGIPPRRKRNSAQGPMPREDPTLTLPDIILHGARQAPAWYPQSAPSSSSHRYRDHSHRAPQVSMYDDDDL